MKKKLFLIVISLLLVALCLVGCADYSQQLGRLNKCLNGNYSKIVLNVTVTQGQYKLYSVFEVVYGADNTSTITFTIQRLATFTDETDIPDSFIETFEGSATLKYSEVTSVTGDVPNGIELPFVGDFGLNFSQSCLNGIKMQDDYMSAKVTNPKTFMGVDDFTCKEGSMSVAVEFGALIQYIRIQYQTNNNSKVLLEYTFTA